MGRRHAEVFFDVLRGKGFAQPNPRPMFGNPPGLLRRRAVFGGSAQPDLVGLRFQRHCRGPADRDEPASLDAEERRNWRVVPHPAGSADPRLPDSLERSGWRQRQPRVSVTRSIFALMDQHDRAYFGHEGQEGDLIGFLGKATPSISRSTDAAEPDVLIEQLKQDEAIAEADTLLLTVPNQLGVAYNAHVIEAVLTHVAPALRLALTFDPAEVLPPYFIWLPDVTILQCGNTLRSGSLFQALPRRAFVVAIIPRITRR